MTLLYFDCRSGISGDMTLGALIDLGVPVEVVNNAVQSVLNTVHITAEPVQRKNFRATQACVHAPREHVHRHLSDIVALIEKSNLSFANKERAVSIFRLIAEAEAKVHGVSVEEVHFHEVGAADSIADICGVVVALDHLNVDEIRASAIPTGTGTIEIAHGTCSIPAAATAELLKGIPIAASSIPFELTTPTGAAILKFYVKEFCPLPSMTIRANGIGAGSRDMEQQANILRVLMGDPAENHSTYHSTTRSAPQHQYEYLLGGEPVVPPTIQDTAWIVETNLDDTTGELIGYCVDQLWQQAPLDVWTTAIQMKKQRPGITISVLCRQEQIENIERILFSETTTLGIRRFPVDRTLLNREPCRLNTPWGEVKGKKATLPDGTEKIAPELESVKQLAAEKGVAVRAIMDRINW
jgi:uncharacterized protein (TIGR00299 family) protein